MKRNTVLSTVAGACFLLPSAFAFAEEKGEPAQIRLSHGVLRYSQTKDETKDDNDTEKEEATSLTTFPAGIEIAAFVNGYSFYAYPVQQGASMWLGKAIGSNMEAGLSASLNFRNVKDGDEASYNSVGGYYFYTRPISSSVIFEFDINPALIMGKSKSKSGSPVVETTTDNNGYSLYFDLLGVVPIAKNFEYVFGLDYTMTKYDSKTKIGGGTSETIKHNSTDLGLILAKFRYFI